MEQSDLDLLQTVPPYHLQAVVKARHVQSSLNAQDSGQSSNTPSSTASLPTSTNEIAQFLLDPVSIREAFAALTDIEKSIVSELVACGGRANSRDLALYLTYGGLLISAKKNESAEQPYESLVVPLEPIRRSQQAGTMLQYPTAHPHGLFELGLRHLLLLGLLFWGRQTNFAGRDYTSGVHDGVLIVPVGVVEVLRPLLKKDEDQIAAHVGEDVGDAVRTFQRTLYLYWSMVATMREGLALVGNGLLTRSALRHTLEHIGNKSQAEQAARLESDIPRLLFIRLLMMQIGLLQERHGVIYAMPAEAFFALPLVERARRCCNLYLDTPFWNELLYLPEVNVRPAPGPLEPAHEELVRARQVVVKRMIQEAFDTRHEFSAFIARTKLYIPYLLFPRQYGARAERYSSSSNPYGRDFRLRRGWLTHREGWSLVEGGFIRAVLAGPLHWLGIVELDQEEHYTQFRNLPGIATILSPEAPVSEDIPWGRLIIQPNFELVALAPVSEVLLVTLDRFAERVSLEHIAQYRLTKASVTRAIQKGIRVETIQAELERAAGNIPQNVRYSLVEWERQVRRVELWQRMTLLEVDDANLLDALFADQETRSLFGRRLSPVMAEVASHQLLAVQEVLWQRNYLPALTAVSSQDGIVETGRLVAREPQWRLHDDGLLHPLYAVSDLYLVAEVERFSAKDEATGWYKITPTTLEHALEHDLELDYIVRFLQQYCEDGIPGSLLIRLKLWGGGYGEKQRIYVERAPLLRLSAQILQDLRADEELKTLLGDEVEQKSHLVHIQGDDLERVIKLLDERGFTIDP